MKEKLANQRYLPILREVEKQLMKKESVIVAIDGRCSSGKSSLAAYLSTAFDCNVFHMDDFFLPFEMKTKERMAQPGGNVHVERFMDEVLHPLTHGEEVTYHPYNCSVNKLDEPIHNDLKHLSIIEGVYSMHPKLNDVYDCKIFLTVDQQVQQERIVKRNGEEKLQKFKKDWIPLEEHYFSELQIPEKSDLVFDTTDWWK
ncbi:uridine kinase family protein [Virgibacillus ainsalahensis]